MKSPQNNCAILSKRANDKEHYKQRRKTNKKGTTAVQ